MPAVDPILPAFPTAEGRSEAEWVSFHADMLGRLEAKTRALVDMVGENRWDRGQIWINAGYAPLKSVGLPDLDHKYVEIEVRMVLTMLQRALTKALQQK